MCVDLLNEIKRSPILEMAEPGNEASTTSTTDPLKTIRRCQITIRFRLPKLNIHKIIRNLISANEIKK